MVNPVTGKEETAVAPTPETKDLQIAPEEVNEAKAKLSGMDSAEAEIFNRLEAEEKAKETKPAEAVKDPEPVVKDTKAKFQEIAKKGSAVTKEDKEAVADHILDRFKDKGDPAREVAKSYFFAERVITKQGQKLAEAKEKINALSQEIESLKTKGQDTGKASAELESTLDEYAEIVGETQTGEQDPTDTRTETEKLIESALDKKLAPVYKAQVIQENLRRDYQLVSTLREKYPDFTELEPSITEIITSKKVDILNPNKIEIAYLMAKGLKSHKEDLAKAQGTAKQPDPQRKADKEIEKAKAYTETAGNPETGDTESYNKKLERAKTSGDSDAWADVIAEKLNL